jgi:hypothetical protein
VGRRPDLWGAALRQVIRLAPSGWWKRAPFLPVPSGPYLVFRAVTQYGSEDQPPVPSDVVNYLSWCKRVDR